MTPEQCKAARILVKMDGNRVAETVLIRVNE